MDLAASALIVIILGICGSGMIHLAKVMERHGIEIFDEIRAKLKNEEIHIEGKVRKPIIYFIGVTFNYTEFLLIMIANAVGSGNSALYTSMWGTGLVIVLVYSSVVLHEQVTRKLQAGTVLILAGSVVLGIEAVFRPNYDQATISIPLAYLFLVVLGVIGAIAMFLGAKAKSSKLFGVASGVLAGGVGSLDVIFKNIGQSGSGSGHLIPTNVLDALVFLSSFGISGVSFIVSQWGFARKAPASVVIPVYDSMYLITPILFQVLLLQGYELYYSTLIGIALIVIGFVLMKAFSKEQLPEKAITQEAPPALENVTESQE
jgi:uncharacterized membrane protein